MTIQEASNKVRKSGEWQRFDCTASDLEGCRGTYGCCSRCNYHYAVCDCGAYHDICKCGVFAEYEQVEGAVAAEATL